MKKLALFGFGFTVLLASSAVSLAIQCRPADSFTPKVSCTFSGTATFRGGTKVPIYRITGLHAPPLKSHYPYINFYIPKEFASKLMILYDGGLELVPKGYDRISYDLGGSGYTEMFLNKDGSGHVTEEATGGAVISACDNASWFRDPEDIRECGMPLSELKPPEGEVPLRKDYRHKTVLAKYMDNSHHRIVFSIEQGSNAIKINLPKNQLQLARVLADYYYYQFTH